MIFAAGLGTRLKPFTDRHPKALVEIGGKPAIQHVVERMADAGINRIVVNVHHFADQVVKFLYDNKFWGLNIVFSDERNLLLDTGGGLKRAAQNRLFKDFDEPILVHNADVITDLDLRTLRNAHKGDVTLLTSPRQSSRMLYFNEENRLKGWQNLKTGECRPDGFNPSAQTEARAFNGIHVLTPRHVMPLMKEVENPVFSIIPFYLSNCDRLDVRGFSPGQPYRWFDVGRPETLKAANDSFGSGF